MKNAVVGAANTVLTSNGPGKAPTFQAPAGGGGEFKELSLSLNSDFTGSSKAYNLKLLTNHKGLVLIECTVQNGFDLQITKNQFTLGKATSADADFRGNCSYVAPTVTGTGILIGSTGNSLDGIKVSCNYGEGDKKPFVICTLMNDSIITEKRSYSALLISCSNNYEQIL